MPRELDRWSTDHPVALAIKIGTNWFSAWQLQKALPRVALKKQIGISTRRSERLSRGEDIFAG